MDIIKQENNTIFYECPCGSRGICSFKPTEEDAVIVLQLKCPVCGDTERVTVLQYSDEETKTNLLNNLDNVSLSWVPFIIEERLD